MILADFRTRFPEFGTSSPPQGVPDAYILALAADAELEVGSAFGPLRTTAVFYLTAHKCALSPWGNAVRLSVAKGASTTYEAHYKALIGKKILGARVI